MLYQFEISLSDIDRGLYRTFEFRLNQHPSENGQYLLTRALAYPLAFQENLEFSPGGLADPDAPALQAKAPMGGYELWIEIGNPSAKKLHKASKVSKQVLVYTYKNPDLLKKFVTESGKILPRRVTGMPAHMHRKITREIKRSRSVLLMK